MHPKVIIKLGLELKIMRSLLKMFVHYVYVYVYVCAHTSCSSLNCITLPRKMHEKSIKCRAGMLPKFVKHICCAKKIISGNT